MALALEGIKVIDGSQVAAVADNQLYKSLKGKVKELYAIGDCVTPRRIETAIYKRSKVGREL